MADVEYRYACNKCGRLVDHNVDNTESGHGAACEPPAPEEPEPTEGE